MAIGHGQAYLSWMLPTLRQLHYLKLLAEHGSFSRAAEQCFLTQSALSRSIQNLEQELGGQLLDRMLAASP